jgi:hypothetical protein
MAGNRARIGLQLTGGHQSLMAAGNGCVQL